MNNRKPLSLILVFWCSVLAIACAAETPEDPCTLDAGKKVVTANWLNQSISVFSHPRLVAGCPIDTALIKSIDLQGYAPGPLQIEITPDGTRAVVSLSAGFYSGAGGELVGSPEFEPGSGLLVVNLDTGTVEHEIYPEQGPMGMAISPDGATLYTANFGSPEAPGDTLSVINLSSGNIEQTITTGSFPEQVSLSVDGTLGILSASGENGVQIFQTSNPATTITSVIPTGTDSSDVVIVGNRAVVTNSWSFNCTILDLTNPAAPTHIEDVSLPEGSPYTATHIPGTQKVILTTYLLETSLYVLDLSADTPSLSEPIAIEGGAPMGAAIAADARYVFIPHGLNKTLSVVDLETREVRSLSWLEQTGPTYVAVQP